MKEFSYYETGRRVRQRRQELDMTQGKLACKVGVSGSFIGHIERGEKKASIETLVMLCECLDVSADWLLLGLENRCDRQGCALYENMKALINRYGEA